LSSTVGAGGSGSGWTLVVATWPDASTAVATAVSSAAVAATVVSSTAVPATAVSAMVVSASVVPAAAVLSATVSAGPGTAPFEACGADRGGSGPSPGRGSEAAVGSSDIDDSPTGVRADTAPGARTTDGIPPTASKEEIE
jgi:hypothetical protein